MAIKRKTKKTGKTKRGDKKRRDIIRKGVEVRLYPDHKQQVFLNKCLGCSRYIYNWGLDTKKREYEETKKSSTFFDMCKKLPALKKKEETEWLGEVPASVLQNSLQNLDTAHQKFFKEKRGYPNFKRKHHRESFQLIPGRWRIEDGRLWLSKLDRNIKFRGHREIAGKPKTLTIKKSPAGKYYASMLYETAEITPRKARVRVETTIGVDVGIKDFAILSTGEKIENHRYLKRNIRKLKLLQRALDRKTKSSNRWERQRIRVAKLHEKIANQRKDFQHKLSSRLVRENQTIGFEDLAERVL